MNENPSPRANRPKWPILTMLAIAAGIIVSQWVGPVLRGPRPAEPQQETAETTQPATP